MSEDINVGAISEALNNKMDRDTLNASDTGNINMAGLGMPSDTYIELTLNASGSTYTAPANGWVYFCRKDINNGYVSLLNFVNNNPSNIKMSIGQYVPNGWAQTIIPVKSGELFQADYNSGTNNYFRFIYAQGSESEAS